MPSWLSPPLAQNQLWLKPDIRTDLGVFREQQTVHLHWEKAGSGKRQMGCVNGDTCSGWHLPAERTLLLTGASLQ